MPSDAIIVTTEHESSETTGAPSSAAKKKLADPKKNDTPAADDTCSQESEVAQGDPPATAADTCSENHPTSKEKAPITDKIEARVKELEQALEDERALRSQAEADLEKKQAESAELRKHWREAAGELDRYLRQNQAYNQWTDQELIQKVSQFRFEIRNFTIQYFEDQIQNVKVEKLLLDYLNKYLNLSQGTYETYLKTSNLRSAVLRGFFWCFLRAEVFGQYLWAPDKAPDSVVFMSNLIHKSLGIDAKPADSSDARRKFHMWRANTSSLIAEATQENAKEAAGNVQALCTRHAKEMLKHLSVLSTTKLEAIEKQLAGLISQSLDIDQDICKQVAHIRWDYVEAKSSLLFDNESMELEPGKKKADEKSKVELVLAPGLVKCGKSSGNGFDVEYRLLKTEVASTDT